MFANQKLLGSYQSGQMGQTVNLLAMPSVVRIHHYPLFPKITQRYKDPVFIMRIGFFVFILSTRPERFALYTHALKGQKLLAQGNTLGFRDNPKQNAL